MKATQKELEKQAELQKKLFKLLAGIFGLSAFVIISLIFFAPKVGYFFGFFSKHRNDKDTTEVIKPSSPLFSNIPQATKNDKLTLNGYAQPGMTVVLYLNGPENQRTTVSADGLFTFNDIALISGNNTIFAKAIDSDNVESEASTTYIVSFDKQKPKITINSPKDGETIKNLDKRITITGKLDEKSEIKINDKIAILRPDMNFEFLLGAIEGKNTIKIEATDLAGNTATESLTVNYEKSNN